MISFADILMRDLQRLAAVARDNVKATGLVLKDDWESRFGDDDRIGDEYGNEGNAKRLSSKTLDAREERGYLGDTMLFDPTLEHVEEHGMLADSIELEPFTEKLGAQGRYHGQSGAFTKHPIFPYNEYGLGVPPRTTLLPTVLTIIPREKEELRAAYEAVLGRPVVVIK